MNRQAAVQTQHQIAPASSTQGGILQRKCESCGQHSFSGENCEECGKGTVRRLTANGSQPTTPPPIVHDVLRSSGRPLDAATRTFMEPRFGRDFSRVRIHTDAKAAASARSVDAIAYTVGNDVVFGQGHYAPDTHAGRGLIAHELTHVVQNSTVTGNSTGSVRIGPTGDRFEAEADANAMAVATGGTAIAHSAVSPSAEIGRLSRATFSIGNVQATSDYTNISSTAPADYQKTIETMFTTWTQAQATVIQADVAKLSEAAKKWVLYGLDLLMDNQVTGLDKVQAVKRLIEYAPSAHFAPGSNASPAVYDFEREALSASGWTEKAFTSNLKVPSSTRVNYVQSRLNSGASSSGSATCPSPRAAADMLDEPKLKAQMPIDLEAYLKRVIVPSNVNTQAIGPLQKVADLVQEQARIYYAPYADGARGKGNTFLQQWKYSANLVSTQSQAGTPNKDLRTAYLRSRAGIVGDMGLFATVHYDARCSADEAVLDGIAQNLETQSKFQALVDPILRQKSYTDENSTPKRVMLNTQYDKTNSDECQARWDATKTLCHELMHVMGHDDFRAATKNRTILVEGFPEVLGHYLYEKISGDPALKPKVEAGLTKTPCPTVPPSTIGYAPAGPDAEKIRIAVGNDNFRAAYFLGQLKLAGLQPASLDEHQPVGPDESEADHAAQAVIDSRPVPSPVQSAPSFISAGHFNLGAGNPLEPGVHSDMSDKFGRDFSRVRIYSNSAAAESAKSVNAKAFTVGNDVVFGSGRYSPHTTEGRKLLAHELTHVVQQTGQSPKIPDNTTVSPHSAPQSKGLSGDIKDSSNADERQAETNAQAIANGRRPSLITSSPLGIARDPLAPSASQEHACVKGTPKIPWGRTGAVNLSGMIGERFYMDVHWENDLSRNCNCSCGEYRQFVRGHYISDGKPVKKALWGGAYLDEKEYHEDGDGKGHRYGHRDDPEFTTNKFTDDPNGATGCHFDGTDFPSIDGARGSTVDAFLDFKGQTYDRCTKTYGPVYQWDVKLKGKVL